MSGEQISLGVEWAKSIRFWWIGVRMHCRCSWRQNDQRKLG